MWARASNRRAADTKDGHRGPISPPAPHILFMTEWQKTFKREPPKTKAELREMLTEAVRNTQPEPKRPPKAKRDRS